jgi:membrane-associated HD superfamily phosphohydrolase
MPLILLAGALKAVEAIQQGCELYKEYKGVVLKAKETFDEAKEHVEEVVGLWQFIKSKLFPSPEPPPPVVQETTKTEQQQKAPPKRVPLVQHSEQDIKADLIKNLKIFFKAMIAIDKKIAEQQLRIDTQFIESDELLDVSLDLVIAKKEMEKAQKELRETMVYQSPPELGSLYTDVIEMFGIVQEKQEVTYLLTVKRRKEEWQRKNNLLSKIRQRIAWVIVVALIVLEIWAIIIAIVLARPPT